MGHTSAPHASHIILFASSAVAAMKAFAASSRLELNKRQQRPLPVGHSALHVRGRDGNPPLRADPPKGPPASCPSVCNAVHRGALPGAGVQPPHKTPPHPALPRAWPLRRSGAPGGGPEPQGVWPHLLVGVPPRWRRVQTSPQGGGRRARGEAGVCPAQARASPLSSTSVERSVAGDTPGGVCVWRRRMLCARALQGGHRTCETARRWERPVPLRTGPR